MNENLEVRRKPEQSRSIQTMEAIRVSASTLFADSGIDNVSMTQIAKHAGISKPALYRYYPNKRSLLKELASEAFGETRAALEELIETKTGTASDVLLEGIQEYCRIHCVEPYRIQLKAAINADPELVKLDLEDSRSNATLVASFIQAEHPKMDADEIYNRALLMMELSDSLIRLVANIPKREGDILIKEFVTRFTSDLK